MNKLQVFEYPNAIVLPRLQTSDGPRWGIGGVCDENNHFVETSFYDGGWAKHGGYYDWTEEAYCDEEVVYIGLFLSHWGHFLIDLTGRMWFLQQLAKTRNDFKVAYVGEEKPKGNTLSFLKLLGVKEEQLMHITQPTRFKKVFVPEQSFKSCEWYTDEFVHMLDEMCDVVMNGSIDFSELQNVDKVYFTRKKFSKAVSSEFGEDYFEECFVKNGYQVIAPEMLSLEEQIYVWNHANEIVCINGTIPLNVLFSKNSKLKLTVLNKTSICHENPLILLKMRGITAKFIDIYKEPFSRFPKSLGEGPFLMWPSEQFEEFCVQQDYHISGSDRQKACYFRIEFVKYLWAILGVGNKARRIVSKLIPRAIKNFIKNR